MPVIQEMCWQKKCCHLDYSTWTVYMWLGSSQVRFAHTDVSFPDFSFHRRDSVKDPTVDSQASAPGRKAFTYVALAGTI